MHDILMQSTCCYLQICWQSELFSDSVFPALPKRYGKNCLCMQNQHVTDSTPDKLFVNIALFSPPLL